MYPSYPGFQKQELHAVDCYTRRSSGMAYTRRKCDICHAFIKADPGCLQQVEFNQL